MNRPTYDPDSIARDAAVLMAGAMTAMTVASAPELPSRIAQLCVESALELHRRAWEACLPLNRPALSETHGPGVYGISQMEQELRDLGVRPVTREDDDGA